MYYFFSLPIIPLYFSAHQSKKTHFLLSVWLVWQALLEFFGPPVAGHTDFSLAIHYEQSSIKSHHVQSISLALFCLSRSVRSTQLCCILLRSQVNELPTQEDTVVAHRAGSHVTSFPNPVCCPCHAEVRRTRDHLPGEEARGTKGACSQALPVRTHGGHGGVWRLLHPLGSRRCPTL